MVMTKSLQMTISLLMGFLIVLPQTLSAAPELFFPLQRNNVKILPQRFEYHLLNKDQIQIGDLRLDASLIDFQLVPLNKNRTQFKIRFRWPSGFLKDGELVVKDSSGKALLIKPIHQDHILKLETPDQDRMRESLSAYEITDEVSDLLTQLEKVPFFKFCVHRQEPLTKIYLCSKDLYFKKQGRSVVVKTRDSFRAESYVEINGRTVGAQGIIFLNDPSEFVALRTLLLSGATLELDTRVKSVEFKDVTLSDDEKKILIKAKGAEPVEENLVTRISADEWQIQLEAERPYLYLKGEGDLPLRQEFLIQGPVRKEKTKVTLLTDTPDQLVNTTYDDEVTLKIQGSPGAQLSAADRLSRIETAAKDAEASDEQSQEWTLLNLKKNQENRRYIKVAEGSQTFIAGYDVFRASANNAHVRMMFPFWAQVGLEHWLNHRFAFQFQYDHQISKKSDEPKLSAFDARVKFRNPRGLLGYDPYFGLVASAKSQKIESANVSILSLGLSGDIPSFLFKDFFQWLNFELMVPLVSLDSKYKLDSSFDFQMAFRHLAHQTLYYDFGLRYNSFKVKVETTAGASSESKVQKPYGYFGIGWLF